MKQRQKERQRTCTVLRLRTRLLKAFFLPFFLPQTGSCLPISGSAVLTERVALLRGGEIDHCCICQLQPRLCCQPVWPSGKALDWLTEGPRFDPLRLFFLFKHCGLWTLSCDFARTIYETLKWLTQLPTLMQNHSGGDSVTSNY